MATSTSSDKFAINPTIAKAVMEEKKNYGHAIADMFKDLGTIASDSHKAKQDAEDREYDIKTKKQALDLSELKVQQFKDEVADEAVLRDYMQSNYADLDTWMKDNNKKLLTPKYMQTAKTLSDGETMKMYDQSLSEHLNYLNENKLFIDDKGNPNLPEIRKQLSKDINNIQLLQAFEKKYNIPMVKEEEKLSAKDALSMMKTQAEIAKINHDINNPPKNEEQKLREEYNLLLKGGAIPVGQTFEGWFADKKTGNLKVKTEGITTAKNNLTKQFTGLEQIKQLLLDKYTPDDVGVFDGALQGFREFTNLHDDRSAEIESNRNAFQMALTKALAGGNASNKDLAKVESIIGGAFQTEEGASSKYKSALNQSIIAVEETINQLENAGYDATTERTRLNEMTDFSESIKGWDGSTTIQDYLKNKAEPNTGTTVLRKRGNNTQSTQNNVTPQIKFNFE